MGIFGDAWGSLKHLGTSAGKDLSTAANATGNVIIQGVDAAGNAIQQVVTTVGDVAVTSATDIETGVTSAANTVASGASQEFDTAINAGQDAFDDVKSKIESAVKNGEAKIIDPLAKSTVDALAHEIQTLCNAWNIIESTMSGEIESIRNSAMNREVTQEATQAYQDIAKALGPELALFRQKNYASFGIEVGASASFGVAGEVGLGLLGGLPDFLDLRGYGSVGVTVGVEEGVEADISLVFNNSAPADSGGPSLNVVVSLDVAVGGTVVVSFNLPDFSFGGISIGLAAGEEVGISVGGGYTYIF